MIVYVDDVCFIGSKDSLLLLELKQKFMTKWKCCDLEEIKEFLGICMNYNHKDQKIFINQSEYLKPNGKQCDSNFCQKYQQMVESLMYLMIGSCSNIRFAVVKLA